MPDERPVFDDQGNMDPDFIPVGKGGRILATLVSRPRGFTAHQMRRLGREGWIKLYHTPHGTLVRASDLQALADSPRLGWWRKQPVVGYQGAAPTCAGSRAHVAGLGKPPSTSVCEVCGRTLGVRPVLELGGSSWTARLPEHISKPRYPSRARA